MEIGFIIMMLCSLIIAAICFYLVLTHEKRKCGNCAFYKSIGKYGGHCKGFNDPRFKWECCKHWKRQQN